MPIKDFLEILFSWQVIFLVTFLIFVCKFQESIKIFLEHIGSIKFGQFEVNQRQPVAKKELEEKIAASDQGKEDKAEFYEFLYLSSYLVLNSKIALLWFHNGPSTKENFMLQFLLPVQIPDPIPEKESILSALLVNDLLEYNNGFMKITEKGTKFLKAIRLIQ